MPLTTRPSLTSRHGMIRLASIRTCPKGVFQPDDTFVESLPDDDAVQPRLLQLLERADIINDRDAAGSNDLESGSVDHLLQGRNVRPDENAVAGNVGVDDALRALSLETPRKLDGANPGVFGPAGYFGNAIACIDPDGDAVAPLLERFLHEFRVRDCAGSKNRAADAGMEHLFESAHAAHPATDLDLDLGYCCGDLGNGLVILRTALEGAVEIYHMQPLGAGPFPALRHLERAAIDGHVLLATLSKADCLSIENIDCGINVHKRPKLSSKRSPTFWLFSG